MPRVPRQGVGRQLLEEVRRNLVEHQDFAARLRLTPRADDDHHFDPFLDPAANLVQGRLFGRVQRGRCTFQRRGERPGNVSATSPIGGSGRDGGGTSIGGNERRAGSSFCTTALSLGLA